MNPVSIRNAAIRKVRDFFAQRGMLEVVTPRAVAHPAVEPYIDAVALKATNLPAARYLATSPEFALKKQFAAEMAEYPTARGIYEIAAVFRDDPAGKNHALEFTMIEWYAKAAPLATTLQLAADLIAWLWGQIAIPLEILDLRALFAAAGKAFDFHHEQGATDLYRSLHGKLPEHLNDFDAAIVCFNLLFDEYILPQIRERKNLVAVSHYPAYLGALAFTENGIAERAEIFYRGLELANGYREEFRPDKARALWHKYNEIRRLRGVPQHALDEDLLNALPSLEGVSGIAVGIERVLLSAHPGLKLGDFGT